MIEPSGGWWPLALALLIGYVLGSIPFGLVLTRLTGAGDIRRIGSGNIGATNVLRTGRKGLALATLLLDAAKGGLPVALALAWAGPEAAAVAGAGAIVGHCFPVWLGFKGGKGVATAAGVVLVLTPLVLVLILVAFVAIVWATRWVSLGSITAAALAPIVAWLVGDPTAAGLYVLIAAIVILKHRENIGRLLRGQENRLSFGGRPAS
ncbi:glycerol-3-phosphate 1-O-acyltransferase PlsY [Benzoatithermus flavus]|uniref:Glycerol-3-phosphate acyltransferase n=1 Tax=Benzoatithermus flavus TaxID=3108223 RepID=A0ABU8XNL2_9PROT